MKSLASLLALAIATSTLASDPVAVDIRLFHGPAESVAEVGVVLGASPTPDNLRKWSPREMDEDSWKRRVDALADSEAVSETPLPGRRGELGFTAVVTEERPWQVDATVQMPATTMEGGNLTVSFVEVPLRLALWLEKSKGGEPVLRLEGLLPTSAAGTDGSPVGKGFSRPLATKVAVDLSDQPTLVTSTDCGAQSCLANVLAVRRVSVPAR